MSANLLPGRLAPVLLSLWLVACGGSGPSQGGPAAGHALRFDGVDDFVTASTGTALFVSALTVEAWIRPDVLAGAASARVLVVGDAGFVLALDTASPGDAVASVCDGFCDAARSTSAPIQVGVWHHVALTHDGVVLRLYVDGVQAASKGFVGDVDDAATLRFGLRPGGAGLAGLLDEVRIWNHARSAGQIAADRFLVLAGSEPGLLAYYRFEEGSGQLTADLGPNNHPARLGASVAAEADDPQWVAEGAPVN